MKKLYKTEGPYKMVAGVCGGIAEYFDIDPTLVSRSISTSTPPWYGWPG